MVKQNYPKDFYVGNFRKVGTELLPKIFLLMVSQRLWKTTSVEKTVSGWTQLMRVTSFSSWWFQVSKIFYLHPETWGRFPFWLIFFHWVETTNQFCLPSTQKLTENKSWLTKTRGPPFLVIHLLFTELKNWKLWKKARWKTGNRCDAFFDWKISTNSWSS